MEILESHRGSETECDDEKVIDEYISRLAWCVAPWIVTTPVLWSNPLTRCCKTLEDLATATVWLCLSLELSYFKTLLIPLGSELYMRLANFICIMRFLKLTESNGSKRVCLILAPAKSKHSISNDKEGKVNDQ